MEDGKVQITHIASGALCGLAGITPASGFVEAWAGIPIGIAVGAAGWYAPFDAPFDAYYTALTPCTCLYTWWFQTFSY